MKKKKNSFVFVFIENTNTIFFFTFVISIFSPTQFSCRTSGERKYSVYSRWYKRYYTDSFPPNKIRCFLRVR